MLQQCEIETRTTGMCTRHQVRRILAKEDRGGAEAAKVARAFMDLELRKCLVIDI